MVLILFCLITSHDDDTLIDDFGRDLDVHNA
jgi:hypothetical protein